MSTLPRSGMAIVALTVLCAAVASAQPRDGVVSGVVMSGDGARLPRATLTLTNDSSGQVFRASADELGAFALARLPAGAYTLVIEFPGLEPRTMPIDVGSAAMRLDVVLEPMRVTQHVTVSAAIPRDSVEVTTVRESPARDVGELLADETGLWMLRKGAIASDVVLRGLQSRDLNVLIDGERLYGACPNHMDPPAFHVDFSQVERVDVGKGPFDVRHQGSLGGIVNVVTKRPEEGWAANAALAAGSYGFVNPSATVSNGGERTALLGGVSYRRSDPYTNGRGEPMTAGAGYRAGAEESDAFRAATVWGRAAWRPATGHELEVSYSAQRTDHTLYPYLQMDAVYDNADRLSLDYKRRSLDDRMTGLTAQVYWSRVDHWMTDQYRTSSTTAPRDYSMATDAQTYTVGGRVEAEFGATSVGGEVFRRNWNSETLLGMRAYAPQFSIPDVDIDTAGAFVEHTRVLNDKIVFNVGGRLDAVRSAADPTLANLSLYAAYHGSTTSDRTDLLPSASGRITYELADDLRLTAALGHTARVAEANERFFALQRMGTDWVGNPDLAPARNTGIDVSASYERPRLTITANGYLNAVHDYLSVYNVSRAQMVPGVMNASARSYANVEARLRGVEANGSVILRSAWTVSGDVSYVRGTMTPDAALGITSSDLAEMPPLRGRLRLRFDDGRAFAEVEGVASAAQNHVDTALHEEPTPSWAIVNLTGGVRHGRFAATAGIANLFDRYYVEHLSYQRDPFRSGVRVAEPGLNVFTNITWRF